MIARLACFMLSALTLAAGAADRVVLCGMGEIFMVDPAAEKLVKVWSWKASGHPEIPADIVKSFGTTAECKPLAEGKRMLITSSGGGCALLELPSGKPLWSAKVKNAHSIESLPGGRIVVASSVGGDQLVLFDEKSERKILWSGPLRSAHGVVWDEGRKRLYALGYTTLESYSLKDWESATPSLVKEQSFTLPDQDGHDLRPVPNSPDLVFSTHGHVWLFDREKGESRAHPDLKDRPLVKSLDYHPKTGAIILNQGGDGKWWSEAFELVSTGRKVAVEKERLYKARWLVD